MRLLFTGGGTGGHVSPAIAIAEYAKEHYKNTDIIFVGRLGGDENRAIIKKGYRLIEIKVSAPTKKINRENIKKLIGVIKAIKSSKKILKEWKPDAVIGTGGYVSFPVVRAAQKMGIPTYLHESNAYPGLVTRMTSKRAKKVFLNIDEASKHLKTDKNAVLVGNPIIQKFGNIKKDDAKRKLGIASKIPFIVSFGGSGGAEKLNTEIIAFMERCIDEKKDVACLHATGKRYYEKIKESHPRLTEKNSKIKIVPYIENMPEALAASDLVISRSGAMTCTELAASDAAAILIPSPNVKDNHQYKNARYFSDKGAAILIEESDLTNDKLYRQIFNLINDKEALHKIKLTIAPLYNKYAARDICRVVFDK